MSTNDARVLELRFLEEVANTGTLHVEASRLQERGSGTYRLALHLVHHELLNSVDTVLWNYSHARPGDALELLREAHARERSEALAKLLEKQNCSLSIGHAGRLRIAELREQLKASRRRDAFGLMWDREEIERDLAVALIDATADTPVAVAFADMNGLKAINDSKNHGAGDEAIRAYMEAIVSSLPRGAEAYRRSGDEVVVIFPSTDSKRAGAIIRRALAKLTAIPSPLGGTLSGCAAVVAEADRSADPVAMLTRVDERQNVAKAASKTDPRSSVLVVEGGAPEVVATALASRS